MISFVRNILGHTPSVANKSEHWGKRHARARRQRADAAAAVFDLRDKLTFPITVTLVRVSPRPLDSDNLAASLKAIRDGICDGLLPANRRNQSQAWADDSDGQIEWRYEQRRGEPAVEFRIEPKGV